MYRSRLLDEDSAGLLAAATAPADPLGFTDLLPYPERLRQAREKTGLDEAVVCARGAIHGHPVAAAVMDFRFLGESMGAAAGDLIAGAADVAPHDLMRDRNGSDIAFTGNRCGTSSPTPLCAG